METKFYDDRFGRGGLDDICAAARKLFGCELISGVAEVSAESRADELEGFVASFLDARRSWYVRATGGGRLIWRTEPAPDRVDARDAVFVFAMGLGEGSSLPQPSGRFDLYVNDEQALSFRVTTEPETWRAGDAAFHFAPHRVEVGNALHLDAHLTDESKAAFGLGFLRLPARMLVPGHAVRLEVVPRFRQPSRRWFKLDSDRFARVLFKAYLDDGLRAVCARDPIRPTAGEWTIFFGDIHCHSGEGRSEKTCGLGMIEENYRYASDVACLDFFALTDHDWQTVDQDDWRARAALPDRYEVEGRFVALPAYEWTSLRYGHRNVYFLDRVARMNWSVEGDSPVELWDGLRDTGIRAFTAAHHPSTGFFPVDWRLWNPEFDRLVEIYSCWGNAEHDHVTNPGWASDRQPGHSVRHALSRGHRLGFYASSDGHDGHPGDAQWSDRQPHIHHLLGSGRAAVLAERLTREAVFDALYARRCYATTGPRIGLDFRLAGREMGSEDVAVGRELPIFLNVLGTRPLDAVDLIVNGSRAASYAPEDPAFEIETAIPVPAESGYAYLRVRQTDGEMAWSSPVWWNASR